MADVTGPQEAAVAQTLAALQRAWGLVVADPQALAVAAEDEPARAAGLTARAACDAHPGLPEDRLAGWLRRHWWSGTRPFRRGCETGTRPAGRAPRRIGGPRAVASALDAACRAVQPRTDDWLVIGAGPVTAPEPGTVVLARRVGERIETREVDAVQLTGAARRGEVLRVGERVSILGAGRTLDDGGRWSWSCGEAGAEGPSVSVYLDVDVEAALRVLPSALRVFGPCGAAVRLACPVEPDAFTGRGSVVVHLPADQQLTARAGSWVAHVGVHTRGRIPPLTRPLASGVSWAEDPGRGATFADLRCAAVAAAVRGALAAVREGTAGDQQSLARVLLEGLRGAGVDPGAPERIGPAEGVARSWTAA